MNKVAVITGAALGYRNEGPSIGGAICFRLALDGYDIVVVDINKLGSRTAEKIVAAGGNAVFVEADVTLDADIRKVIDATKTTFGGVTCLVNCVASYSSGMAKNIVEIGGNDWSKTLEVNLNGYYKMCKYAIPLMLDSGGGAIINISSIESFIALNNFGVYSVSKAAVDALTRSIAVDFAPRIRANSVCPGFVRIANSENNRTPEELKKWYVEISEQYPMKRVCEVEEIAGVVSFLAGEDSSYVTGQSIVVDGGKTISDRHQF